MSDALVKAKDRIEDLLPLIERSEVLDEAITLYLDHCMAQADWTSDIARRAIAASSASEEIWDHVLAFMNEDQSSATRAADLVGALMEKFPNTLPGDAVGLLTPVLRDAGPELAEALGHALRPSRKSVNKLRRAMSGFSSTPAQRARNAAFKEDAGL
ncbi:hypothetical protein [Streptomyces jumonjinensis]|uniref:hypothetical protein n=1 Tax=Streptomyces jumonjinensis TaxID=1945 RepID=UPI0037A01CCA